MAEEHKIEDFDVWLNIIKDSFAKQGYEKVSMEDLWEYCEKFLTYVSLKAQVYNVSPLDEMDLDGLF